MIYLNHRQKYYVLTLPLVPLLILLLESIIVNGVEYPIGTPVKRQTDSAKSSNTCARGRKPSNTSSG